MGSFTGKFFSITDQPGANTVIYRINKTDEQYRDKVSKYTVERLVSQDEINGERRKKTFFVDYPEPDGEDLVILTFAPNKVVVNMGKLKDDRVKVSKTPIPVKFDTIVANKENEYKSFKYTPNFKRPITIIDPETAEEIEPKLYFDNSTNEIKGKIKMKPNKSYFTFEIE